MKAEQILKTIQLVIGLLIIGIVMWSLIGTH